MLLPLISVLFLRANRKDVERETSRVVVNSSDSRWYSFTLGHYRRHYGYGKRRVSLDLQKFPISCGCSIHMLEETLPAWSTNSLISGISG